MQIRNLDRALLNGEVTEHDFEENRFRDPESLTFMKKITLRFDRTLSDTELGARMKVTLRSGQSYHTDVPIPPGHMRNPADDASLEKKFIDLSKGILGRARAEKAIETILSLNTMADLENLVGALTPSNRG